MNKLQNSAIPLILKIGKIRNIRFVGNLILKIHRNFFDDDVITVTSSVHRTQSICVLFSPPVFYHNCHFRGCKAPLSSIVSGAISSELPFFFCHWLPTLVDIHHQTQSIMCLESDKQHRNEKKRISLTS